MSNVEEMVEQLLKMVGSTNAGQDEIKAELKEIKNEQQEMKAELQEIKNEQQEMKAEQQSTNSRLDRIEHKIEQHYEEMQNGFRLLKVDQDYIWKKVVHNELELEKLKNK